MFGFDFLWDWLVWSPCSSRDSQESSPTPQLESINSSVLSPFMVQLSHPNLTTRKTVALTIQTFVGKEMSLLFITPSRFVTVFLPRIKQLLISWLQSPSTVILEPKKIKSVTVSPNLFAMKWWDQVPWSLFFECWVLSQLFHSPFSASSGGSLVLYFLPLKWYHLHIWGIPWWLRW